MHRLKSISTVLMLLLTTLYGSAARANQCPPLTAATRARILEYLAKWFSLPATETLSIDREDIIPGTCYRRLSVRTRTLGRRSFFLSEDQRFASGDLLDTMSDPKRGREQLKEEVKKLLLSDMSPSRGPSTAAVTIVEFADFQCPYCARMNDWFRVLASENELDVRVVFKHLPLQGHNWAHDAAAIAICAESQASGAFWQLHDFYFDNQTSLNAANLQERAAKYVSRLPGISPVLLQNCLHGSAANANIVRDMQLAKEFQVNTTPTLFVNGVRAGDLQSLDQLRDLIREARDSGAMGRRVLEEPDK